MSSTAWMFILIWSLMILTPCVAIGWLGFRFLTKLGQFPSKTPVLQKNIMLAYLMIVITSFTVIIFFFKVLTAEQ